MRWGSGNFLQHELEIVAPQTIACFSCFFLLSLRLLFSVALKIKTSWSPLLTEAKAPPPTTTRLAHV